MGLEKGFEPNREQWLYQDGVLFRSDVVVYQPLGLQGLTEYLSSK